MHIIIDLRDKLGPRALTATGHDTEPRKIRCGRTIHHLWYDLFEPAQINALIRKAVCFRGVCQGPATIAPDISEALDISDCGSADTSRRNFPIKQETSPTIWETIFKQGRKTCTPTAVWPQQLII
ncbi:hypothetical protein BGC31_01935 [Komagataeibacter xylinus]|nr:hypothetical protein BFX83_11105 [Komagataeibacter xylinus]RFP00546.1 hypothetical protein BGC31_01935 [Komagataeibacter xylinus]